MDCAIGESTSGQCWRLSNRVDCCWVIVGPTLKQRYIGCVKGWVFVGPMLAQYEITNIGATARITLVQWFHTTLAQYEINNILPTLGRRTLGRRQE